MTWIKICGITNLEDARVAVDAGADAVGFVFYEKSPRNIQPEAAREIVSALPAQVEKVGVFVEGYCLDSLNIAGKVGLTAIQNTSNSPLTAASQGPPQHALGSANPPRIPKWFVSAPLTAYVEHEDAIRQFGKSLSALRTGTSGHSPIPDGWFETFFVDSGTLQQPGGTGKVFDWEKAVRVADAMRDGGLNLVVAGGLNPANVTEAMRILKPWGVDVSSGVEARPGKKDPEKVRAFIDAVRAADENI